MTLDEWLACVISDLNRRKLQELRPVVEALARATATLRAATWSADASGRSKGGPGDDVR